MDITDTIIDDGTTAIDGIDSFDPIADIKDEENSDPDLEKTEEEATESTASGSGVEFQYSMLRVTMIILFTSCFLLKRQISPMTQSFYFMLTLMR